MGSKENHHCWKVSNFAYRFLAHHRLIFATELGINFSHIRAKSMTVLNPLRRVDDRIMDDADLAGPLLFFFCFGVLLLLVSLLCHFNDASHLVSIVWEASVWIHLRLWIAWFHLHIHVTKPHVGKWYRCIPRSICARLLLIANGRCWGHQRGRYSRVRHLPFYSRSSSSPRYSGILGYVLSLLSIIWCTFSASGIFVAVLRMSDQRLLVAYPVALLYGCFGLLSVFNVGAGSSAR